MSYSENFRVSPKYSVNDWKTARDNSDWAKMINIFKDRIEGRFLKPIELIATHEDIKEFSGFSILALDCLVIEALQQFHEGKNETPRNRIKNAFITFLTTRESFKNFFNEETASTFFDHFRCGLLHQAQTKEKSLIKISREAMVEVIENGLIIDRKKFHDALLEEIDIYVQLLSKEEEHNLKANFIKKMDFICNCA